jgi:hypothetical protein
MKINVGDRVKLLGGYHMEPKWLHGGDGYPVIIIDFLENSAPPSSLKSRLSSMG